MPPLPVFVLTGFLGSGKTTLLARVLRDPGFADTAVVVNELGDVGLDHVLVDRGSEQGVVLLDSGCLCCALGNSLQETLEDLHYRRGRGELPPFARVVVETTGVADPGPIAATLALDAAIARHYRLGGIVTTVDAVHGADQLMRFPEAVRQVAYADRLFVTKTDIAAADATTVLCARLSALNPHAVRALAIAGAVPAEDVLTDSPMLGVRATGAGAHVDVHDHARAEDVPARGAHTHLDAQGIAAATLRLDATLDWPRYAAWVDWMQRNLGDALLRVKGMVRMDDDVAYALHAVMRMWSAPRPLPAMPPELGNGVVIVIAQNAPPELLAEAKQHLA